ncbi:hypothetical protein, partial [Ruthenibacterium lactatiformans]|uniref:hypothetical protein n=1 Tax=Ruthenibacterium lactatiformans TaxID=1550024 RepID=UPI003AF07144
LFSFHFLTPFPGAFSALLGVYLFSSSFATKLHFFLGVFFHFITGADTYSVYHGAACGATESGGKCGDRALLQ